MEGCAMESAHKLLIFVATANPLWVTLLGDNPTQQKIAQFIGVSAATLTNWKHTGRIDQNRIRGIFETIRERLSRLPDTTKDEVGGIIDAFEEEYESRDNTPIGEIAIIFGMTTEECNMIIDEAIYSKRPLFPRLYYDNTTIAQEYLDGYQGVMLMWAKQDDSWAQCPIHIRYVLELDGGPTIRCSLNLPGSIQYETYDGFLARRDDNDFWIFEKKQRIRNNYIYIITNRGFKYNRIGHERGRVLTLTGNHLTTSQERTQKILTGVVIIQHMGRMDPADLDRIMEQEARVLDRAEAEKIDRMQVEVTEYLANSRS
jgi:hypothetical protein